MTNDDDIWRRYAKNVKKIGRAKSGLKPAPLLQKQKANDHELVHFHRADARHAVSVSARTTSGIPQLPATLDRREEKNLRSGMIPIEARLDLHGLTQAEAFDRLARFIAAQVRAGRRRLLVITGKGSRGEGVLRQSLPGWLHSLPEAAALLAVRPAAARHGGDGAFYVLLRNLRQRQESVTTTS